MNIRSDRTLHHKDNPTVACINFAPIEGDKRRTLNKLKDFAIKACDKGTDIIVFPEIALGNVNIPPDIAYGKGIQNGTLRPAEMFKLAETIPGPSTEEIARLAAEYNVYIIFGMLERSKDKYYNSAAVTGPAGVMGAHRKIHFRSPWEVAWISKGSSLPVFSTRFGPMGIGICFESYCVPEVARSHAIQGARLFLNVTAFPKFPDCQDYREFYLTTLGCRSIENQMFVASANIVGKLGGMVHWGRSLILGPKPGSMNFHIFAGPASEINEEIVIAKLNYQSLKRLPFSVADSLKDRMPRLYKNLIKQAFASDNLPTFKPGASQISTGTEVKRHGE